MKFLKAPQIPSITSSLLATDGSGVVVAGGVSTGNTLWVDADLGNDGTAAANRQDLPYETLQGALADAASGDLIHVRPGAYTCTSSLAADGVNWHFEAGATVSQATGGSAGIFDDGGTAMTFTVTGFGSFSLDEDTTFELALIHVSHASSVISIECQDLATTGTQAALCVLMEDGTLDLKCRNMSASGTDATYAVRWTNGMLSVRGVRCYAQGFGLSSEVASTPTGDFYADFDEIVSDNYALWEYGSNTAAAWWVHARRVYSAGGFASITSYGHNRTYITADKLFGPINTDSVFSGMLYVNADKIVAMANAGTGSNATLLYAGGTSTGVLWLNIRHWDSSTYTGEMIRVTSPIVNILGGRLTGISGQTGLNHTGGTMNIKGFYLDTSAYSSTTPIIKNTSGVMTLDGCTLVAHSSADSVTASTSRTVAVTGILTANRPVNANVTLTGGALLRSDTGAYAFNGAASPAANDGAALGAATTAWSDLFLASGAVVNFNNGNLTLTHSSGAMAATGTWTFPNVVISATTSLLLGTAGSAVGNIGFRNATSGTATLAPPTGALGTYTVTLPNAASTLPIFGQQITFSGPTAARTVTFPDASFTAARTDAANTFTGASTTDSWQLTTPALVNTEISVTGATTATINRWHVCSGTSADYTVTLPTAVGQTGKEIAFRMSTALTKRVTLDGNSSETIDGATTRVMWAGEYCVLRSDGSNWYKVGGKTIPMRCQLVKASHQTSIATDDSVLVLLDTSLIDNTGAMANTGSNRIDVKRAGSYRVWPATRFYTPSATTRLASFAVFNASTYYQSMCEMSSAAGAIPVAVRPEIFSFASGDYVQLYAYVSSTCDVRGTGSTEGSSLMIEEVDPW